MDTAFENLESSLSFEDSLLGQTGTIDQLYHTYLSNMDSFPKDTQASYSAEGYYAPEYSAYGNYNPDFYSEQGGYGVEDESCTYRRLAIADWQGQDCAAWAESVCHKKGLDPSSLDMWGFKSTSGAALLQFSPQHFCTYVGDQYASIFFHEFQNVRKQKNGKARSGLHTDPTISLGAAPSSSTASSSQTYNEPDFWEYTSQDLKDLERYIPADIYDPLSDELKSLDVRENFMAIKYEELQQQYSPPSAAGPEQDVFKKIPTNTRRKERGPKSWEFLVRLLADKRTNPALIRWEDEASATFRLTQPTIIAQMWGARADKPNLSYVNFARGLRYHYNTGALEAVSERQLVYRCGPKALLYLNQLRSETPSGSC